jgi:hypothetical protein
MKQRWVKDYCPYAKDQKFDSITGNVYPGEQVFGFTHTQVAASDKLVFATETHNRVTYMKNTAYRVQVTKVSAGSVATVAFAYEQYKDYCRLYGEAGEIYDIIIIGRIGY